MKHKSLFILILGLIGFSSCEEKAVTYTGEEIIQKSIQFHDPQGNWSNSNFEFHIQEPRAYNPQRYSLLKMDNSSKGRFELARGRGNHVSSHIVESDGTSVLLLDGKKDIDPELIKEYNLSADDSPGYKEFYQFMYTLPMSFDQGITKVYESTESVFDGVECYKVKVELNKEIITKYWNIYIAKSDFTLLGVEITNPDEPGKGERLFFERTYNIGEIKIPRIRHWYDLNNDEYLGSDLIIGPIGQEE